MWLLFWLSLGWLISSVGLYIGERRGIRMTDPTAAIPGLSGWWMTFSRPYRAVYRWAHAAISYVFELVWRLVKG